MEKLTSYLKYLITIAILLFVLLNKILPQKEIMDLMGHVDIKTTDNYTHSNREIADKIIGMWDDLNFPINDKKTEQENELNI